MAHSCDSTVCSLFTEKGRGMVHTHTHTHACAPAFLALCKVTKTVKVGRLLPQASAISRIDGIDLSSWLKLEMKVKRERDLLEPLRASQPSQTERWSRGGAEQRNWLRKPPARSDEGNLIAFVTNKALR